MCNEHDYKRAFYFAYENGHIEVAQCLYSLNINIHVDNEVFKWTARNSPMAILIKLQYV